MRISIRLLAVLLLFSCTSLFAADGDFTFRSWLASSQTEKLDFVTKLIQALKNNGTTLRLPAAYYVHEMDSLVANTQANEGDPGLNQSVGYSFKTIAVMDCDWDNGQDRLRYAQKLMGPDIFAAYQKNYPEKYQHLVKGCH